MGLFKKNAFWVSLFFFYTASLLYPQSSNNILDKALYLRSKADELFLAGQYNEALSYHKKSADIIQKTVGRNHPGTGAANFMIGGTYAAMKNYDQALRYYEISLNIFESIGHENQDMLAANVASIQQLQGDYQAAVQTLKKLAAYRKKKLGDSEQTAIAMEMLANAYTKLANDQESAILREKALTILEKINGKEAPQVASILGNLALNYRALGLNNKAAPLAERAFKINSKVLGPYDENTAISLSNLAMIYQDLGDIEQAELQYKKAVTVFEKCNGENHPTTVTALNNLAMLYSYLARYNESEEIFLKVIERNSKSAAIAPLDNALAYNNLAELYRTMGDYVKALPLYERALAIREKALGPEHPDLATSLNNFAELYRAMGDYGKSLQLHERALAIYENALGPNHPTVANSLNNIALLYASMGDYAKALPLYERALVIREKVLGPEHPDVAASLNNLAALYKSTGDYQMALTLFERASAIYEKKLGPEHPITATNLNNIATLYESMGQYQKALPLHERALVIREKALGNEHPAVALSVNNMGVLYKSMGDYTKAVPLFERAIAIREKSLGPEHPDVAQSLNNLAALYGTVGQYPKALPLHERAFAIWKKNLGPEHPDVAISVNNMALLYAAMSDYAKALPLFERAMAIREKALGAEHPDVAKNLQSIAGLHTLMGDYAKALPIHERALVIYEKTLGSEHPDVAQSLNNLALLYASMRDYSKALPLFERAMAIQEKALGPDHPDVAMSLNNLAFLYASIGDYPKSLPLYERALEISGKALGTAHPTTAMGLGNLASLYYEAGNLPEARAFAERHINSKQSELETILTQDEDTRLAWQSVNQPFWLACILERNALADLVLRMKGVVLDSLVEDRSIALAAQSNSEGAESLKKIAQLQARLSKLAFEPDQEEEVARLKGEISQLQRDMAAKYLGRNLQRASATITQADITAKLGEGSALIDFFQFHDPKLKEEDPQCLGAIIMAANNKLEFVRIDGAKAISQAIKSLRNGIANGDAAGVKEDTELLSEKLWRPIAQKIPEGTNQLVISPDGDLNFLSFAALLSKDGKFLAESFDISYVGNARDLLRESNTQPPKRIRIFGNPIFDRTAGPAEENRLAFRSMEVDVFGQIQLPSLPGTEKECAEIQKIAANSGWDLETFTRDRADEKTIRQTSKPGILHLATHGFYLNSYSPPADNTRGMSVIGIQPNTPNKKGVDPMRASGIALTGAQSTLRSWAERKAPDPENDGILTAEEVATLDLQGTWLVSLSACETGVGEARSGEGVLGLRRSFMMAGAENLLMTLWPVSDQTTAEIMADFYREALKTGNAPGALSKVQCEWLVKLRKEKGLLEAVRDAGPFVIATIGKPLPPLPREPAEEPSILDKVTQKIESLIKSGNPEINKK